jgi:tetratricopeptide (TPR) repeat protein
MKATYILLACLLAGCSITGRISRREMVAGIEHIPRPQPVEERQFVEYRPNYIEYTNAENETELHCPTTWVDGEPLIRVTLPEVVVVAESRTIPERNGRVNLDFVVTLPKELMGRCREVVVTPMLHKSGEAVPLQDLSIRGALFNKVQERNYWQYTRYLDLFNPDDPGWAFARFVHYPYPEGSRLDSVVSNKSTISYYYTQEVPTAEAEGDKMQITLEGKVAALDHSEYRFPLSDTLEYFVSSMLVFADTTTRYMTRVIEKYAVVNDRNYLHFPVNKSVIIDTLGDNREQLRHIETLMAEILNQREFHVDSIILTASASPEGPAANNNRLARDRAHALRQRLGNADIQVRWVGEDWDELSRLIRDDVNIDNRAAILELIAATRDRDALDREIKRRYPHDYDYMFEALDPRLRAVDFRYNLRRVGMVKDTIHTTVPDTLYARGVELLRSRKYTDALRILGGFGDRNAAICMLSLGLDEEARQTLSSLPENPTNLYLLATACVRLGRDDEALRHFDRATELNPQLAHRAKLDPEISTLINRRTHEN